MSGSTKKTYLINFISGPGSGKTTMCALIFANLKLKGFVAEYVQEYAKTLVWTKNFETLNNQYHVTQTQYTLLKMINGQVDFILTDGPIPQALYYNRHNLDNTSNIEKTEKLIIDSYNKFNNINIFLDRGDFVYEQQGRIQTEEESKEIDFILKHMLKQHSIPFTIFKSTPENVEPIVNYIIEYVKNENIPK